MLCGGCGWSWFDPDPDSPAGGGAARTAGVQRRHRPGGGARPRPTPAGHRRRRQHRLATDGLLRLSDSAGVERFVYPSSDKSVQPPSVYGATKRIAEGLVQTAAQHRRWAVVRYVNIIGTRGSVIETFTQQVQSDRSLSVTDDRMTRYWISMEEAIWSALMTVGCAATAEV